MRIGDEVSKQERELTEKIFMLNMSINFLKMGRRPFHNSSIRLIRDEIKRLKQDTEKTKNGNS
jgi:hypothetical protein